MTPNRISAKQLISVVEKGPKDASLESFVQAALDGKLVRSNVVAAQKTADCKCVDGNLWCKDENGDWHYAGDC
jgi:hypothetical protein